MVQHARAGSDGTLGRQKEAVLRGNQPEMRGGKPIRPEMLRRNRSLALEKPECLIVVGVDVYRRGSFSIGILR